MTIVAVRTTSPWRFVPLLVVVSLAVSGSELISVQAPTSSFASHTSTHQAIPPRIAAPNLMGMRFMGGDSRVRIVGGATSPGQIAAVAHNRPSDPLFVDINAGLTPVVAGAVAWGDYDRDGLMDLLITGWDLGGGGSTKLYHNNGDGTFTEDTNANLPGVADSAVAWGDYDNDGWPDIAIAGTYSNFMITSIYHNNGNGTFTDIGAGLTGVNTAALAWGDYDNDGRPDLLVSGQALGFGRTTKLYHNNGNGTFTEDTSAGLQPIYYSAVAWGDYDNDGRLDIVICGLGNAGSATMLYHNNGDGTFTEDTAANLQGVYFGSVAWGDYDNDGRLDILLTGNPYFGNNIAKVYHNNGDGTFTEDTAANLPGVHYSAAAWGDYDNDGRLDIMLSGAGDTGFLTRLYHNNGKGSFSDSGDSLPSLDASALAWGDYSNDGHLDLLLTGQINYTTRLSRIYRNTDLHANTPPTPPARLKTILTWTTATLQWGDGTDAQTPVHGLSYNLRVGTTSGGSDVIAPLARSQDDRRLVPALGNAGTNHSWTLQHVEAGIRYYWSVQAIDTGFAGSSFSAEQNFILPSTKP